MRFVLPRIQPDRGMTTFYRGIEVANLKQCRRPVGMEFCPVRRNRESRLYADQRFIGMPGPREGDRKVAVHFRIARIQRGPPAQQWQRVRVASGSDMRHAECLETQRMVGNASQQAARYRVHLPILASRDQGCNQAFVSDPSPDISPAR